MIMNSTQLETKDQFIFYTSQNQQSTFIFSESTELVEGSVYFEYYTISYLPSTSGVNTTF